MVDESTKFLLFNPSIFSLKGHFLDFLFFKPISYDNIKVDFVLCTALVLLNTFLITVAHLTAKIIGLKIFEVVLLFPVKAIIILFGALAISLFYSLISVVYSKIFDNGKFKLSYFYIGHLSSIHLPICVFIVIILKSYSLARFLHFPIMTAQAIISEYLVRTSIIADRIVDDPKKKAYVTIFSCIVFILFYCLVVDAIIL